MSNDKQQEKTVVEFVPFGADSKVRLSIEIVKRLICVKTKSGKVCSDEEAIKFMAMCQARRLNPFEGDAFLIGYDGRDGGATFSLITAHQAFLKRAEVNPEYDGMQSGTVVDRAGTPTDIEGDFTSSGEKLLGGWARVFFKNRKYPMYKRIRLSRFQKNYGIWVDDPAGMIVKCAEADALRSSFPTMLGGLYLQEEKEARGVEILEPTIQRISDGRSAPVPPKEQTSSPEPPPPTGAQAAPPPKAAPPVRKKSKLKPKDEPSPFESAPQRPNQVALLAKLERSQFTRGDFMAIADRNEWLGKGRHWDSMDQVPDDMFSVFLEDEEWGVVLGELEKGLQK